MMAFLSFFFFFFNNGFLTPSKTSYPLVSEPEEQSLPEFSVIRTTHPGF